MFVCFSKKYATNSLAHDERYQSTEMFIGTTQIGEQFSATDALVARERLSAVASHAVASRSDFAHACRWYVERIHCDGAANQDDKHCKD